jgi:hypothetical protein
VQINSARNLIGVTVQGFTLFDSAGTATQMAHIISEQVFDEPYVAGEGSMGRYLNTSSPNRDRPWNGVLPTGTVNLRIRVELQGEPPTFPTRCVVKVGPYTISGGIDGAWAS